MEGINKFYVARVKYIQEEETTTGKVRFRTHRDQYLVNAQSIPAADKTLKSLLGGVYDSFEVISIKQSNIVAVLDQLKSI